HSARKGPVTIRDVLNGYRCRVQQHDLNLGCADKGGDLTAAQAIAVRIVEPYHIRSAWIGGREDGPGTSHRACIPGVPRGTARKCHGADEIAPVIGHPGINEEIILEGRDLARCEPFDIPYGSTVHDAAHDDISRIGAVLWDAAHILEKAIRGISLPGHY